MRAWGIVMEWNEVRGLGVQRVIGCCEAQFGGSVVLGEQGCLPDGSGKDAFRSRHTLRWP
jgi:hypothetical protein